jgi:MFS family permease
MGQLAAMSAMGTTLGPVVGSLVAHVAARAIFLVNVPIGAVAFALALRYVPRREPHARATVSFDVAGTAVLALSLFGYALSMTLPGGPWKPSTGALLAAAICGIGGFVLVEWRSASPLVPVAMFRNALFSASLAASAVVATVVMATLVVGPFYLSGGLGLGHAQIGLILSSGPAAAAMTGSVAGRLAERLGAQRTVLAGLLAMAIGASVLAMLPPGAGIPGYVVPLVVMTAGYAIFQTANNSAALAGSGESRRGVAAGLLSLSRNFGQITGASFMGAVFLHATGAQDLAAAGSEAIATGMRTAFAVAACLLVTTIALVVSTRVRTLRSNASVTQRRRVNAAAEAGRVGSSSSPVLVARQVP